MAVPTIVASATANNNGPVVVTKPTGTADGDIMYAQVTQDDNTATFTAPAGWTAITANLTIPAGGNNETTRIFRKVASGEGANFTFSSNQGGTVLAQVTSVRNGNTTTPENATTTTNTGSSSTPTNPSITTTVNDCLLLLFTVREGNTAMTHPSGSTELWDLGNGGGGGFANSCAAKSAPTAGAQGTNAWSTTAIWAAATVAVAPNPAIIEPVTKGDLKLTGQNVISQNGTIVTNAAIKFAGKTVPLAISELIDQTPNIVLNGAFPADASNWTLTVNGGTAQWDSGGGGRLALAGNGTSTRGTADQALTTEVGKEYRLQFDVTTAAVTVLVGTTQAASDLLASQVVNAAASGDFLFTATSTSSWVRFQRGTSATVGYVDNVTARRTVPPYLKFAGQNVTLNALYSMVVDKATIRFAGQDVSFLASSNIIIDNGALKFTGQNVDFIADTPVIEPVTNGAIKFTGQSVGLPVGLPITNAALKFAGQSLELYASVRLTVDNGVLHMTGQDVYTDYDILDPVTRGALVMTGQNINLGVSLPVGVAGLKFTGQSGVFGFSTPIINSVLRFIGQDILPTYAAAVNSGTLRLTGQGIEIYIASPISNGTLHMTGQSVGALRALVVENGMLTLAGQELVLGNELEPIFHKSTVHLIVPSSVVHLYTDPVDNLD